MLILDAKATSCVSGKEIAIGSRSATVSTCLYRVTRAATRADIILYATAAAARDERMATTLAVGPRVASYARARVGFERNARQQRYASATILTRIGGALVDVSAAHTCVGGLVSDKACAIMSTRSSVSARR